LKLLYLKSISPHLRSSSLRFRPDNCSLLKRIMAWSMLDRLTRESLCGKEVDSETEIMVSSRLLKFLTTHHLCCISGHLSLYYTTIMLHDLDSSALLIIMQLLRPIMLCTIRGRWSARSLTCTVDRTAAEAAEN
jgi:hypothetical protein